MDLRKRQRGRPKRGETKANTKSHDYFPKKVLPNNNIQPIKRHRPHKETVDDLFE